MKTKIQLSILTLVGVFLIFSATVRPQGITLKYIKTDATEFPQKTVSALMVYDNYGKPVLGLGPSNFTAILDGKQGEILATPTLGSTGKGLYTVLCIDISGSMRGKPMEDSKNAVLTYINELGAKDFLAIFSYGDDANLVADFSNDKDYLRKQVKGLAATDQNTALFYGADKGIEKIKDKARNNEPVAMIILGDGDNQSSGGAYTVDDVIFKAKKEGIPVFTFGYTSGNKQALQNLEKIGNETGGRYYESLNRQQLDENFKLMRANILNIYMVTYKIYDLEGKGQDVPGVFKVNKDTWSAEVVEKKISLPAAGSIKKEDNAEKLPLLWIIIAGGVVLIAVVVTLLVLSSKKKKRLALAAEERMKELEREAAAAKAEAAEKRQNQEPEVKSTKEALPPTLIEESGLGGAGSTGAPGGGAYNAGGAYGAGGATGAGGETIIFRAAPKPGAGY